MIGIVLAGGHGTRLWPSTKVFSKHFLHIYDKPMIFYPVSTLMLAGIREIAFVTTPRDLKSLKELMGDGTNLGMDFSYHIQQEPRGIPEAFMIVKDRIVKRSSALILGDNLFYGQGMGRHLKTFQNPSGAEIFAYSVSNPSEYGIVEIDRAGKAISIEEKPSNPRSSFAITGLYFYDDSVVDLVKQLKPSSRGELEISDLNRKYLELGRLNVNLLPRGTAWLDTGTPNGLHDASTFVKVVENRQGMKIGCIEEIAWRNKWITDSELLKLSGGTSTSDYVRYLQSLINA